MNIEDESRDDLMNRRIKQVYLLFAIVASFFLLAEHRAHVLPYLPWLLLAACPLMHMFMHHGHGRDITHRLGEPEERSRDVAGARDASPEATGPSTGSDTSQSVHGRDHD